MAREGGGMPRFLREVTPNGRVYCKICRRPFNSVGAHVWQAHGMSAREYKKEFGLCLSHSLMSDRLVARFRSNAFKFGFNKLDFRVKYKKGHFGAPYISKEARLMSAYNLKNRQMWREDPKKRALWRAKLRKAWKRNREKRVAGIRQRSSDPVYVDKLKKAARGRLRDRGGKFIKREVCDGA